MKNTNKFFKGISSILNNLKNFLFSLISHALILVVLIGIIAVVISFFKTASIYLSTATYTP